MRLQKFISFFVLLTVTVLFLSSSNVAIAASQESDSLGSNQVLHIGQQLSSANGRFSLRMQDDGNLVLYHNNGVGILWSARTSGSGASYVVMQSDGNLVLYRRDNTPVWSSNTVGEISTLTLQNDGNLVIYRNGGSNVWSTNTVPFGLGPNEQLFANEVLSSVNGRFRLIMQSDGNLVLYTSRGEPLWASGTSGKGATRAVMQSDGNLVLYRRDNTPVWSSNTVGGKLSVLRLQGDGNLVIYRDGENRIWATQTARSVYRLWANERLLAGERLDSYNGNFSLLMQADGNLVLYQNSNGQNLWATNTEGTGAYSTIMQSDGNLVLYSTNNIPVWSSNTFYGLFLALSDEGILAIWGKDFGYRWSTQPIPLPPTTNPVPPTPPTVRPNLKLEVVDLGFNYVYVRVTNTGDAATSSSFLVGATIGVDSQIIAEIPPNFSKGQSSPLYKIDLVDFSGQYRVNYFSVMADSLNQIAESEEWDNGVSYSWGWDWWIKQ